MFHDPLMLGFVVITLLISALAHGTLGFGFPLISTPVIALVTDMQTAVVVTVLPNLAVNLVSILRGGQWQHSLGRYWPMAVWVLLGTLLGTQVLLHANPAPLKLLLALMIGVYLGQDHIKRIDWSVIVRHPKMSGMVLGLLAGVLSGAVNVALPPLVIYFMTLGLSAIPLTQILNLCFMPGKAAQAGALGLSGHFNFEMLQLSIPLAIISVVTLLMGMRLQKNIHPKRYRQLVFGSLAVMALLLGGQAIQSFLA